MASSSNRFAILGEDSASSKEQEVPVPVTGNEGMGNQTMQDTAQAGPPISSGGPEGSATRKLTLQEGVALFLKRRAQYLAEEEEHEKAKKSRQHSKPSTSVIPPRDLRKRSASSDEAKEPLKRPRLEPLRSSPTPGQLATSASAASPKGSPPFQDIVPYIDPNLVPWWANIRTPEMPLPCIIQVNYLARMGSFDESTEKWAFHLTLDAGLQQSPAMKMKFFSNGVRRPQSGETGWLLSDVHEDEWMVLNFQIFCLADCSRERRIHHHKVFKACRTDEEKARLICIRLTAWPKVMGRFDNQAEKYFPDVFTGRRPYQLHIWFIAPYDIETFKEQCLKFFTHYFKHRPSVHSKIPPL